MPKRRRQIRTDELTPEQRDELLDDVWPWLVPESSVFESEAVRRKAWEAHREELLAEYIAENPGRRPFAWWHYTAPDGYGRNRPVRTVSDLPDRWVGYSPEVANLDRLGELTDEEIEALRERGPMWGGRSQTD